MLKAAERMMVAGIGLCALVAAIALRAASPNLTQPSPNLTQPSPNLTQPSPDPTQPQSTQAKPPDTAALYKLHCQMCHGANGKAPLPEMAFFERDWKHGTSSAQMAKIIAEGVTGTPMMPFKGKLTTAQITALAKHVRAFDPRLKPEKQ